MLTILVIGCINDNNINSSNNGTAIKNISTMTNDITIDNASIIPVLNNHPTSSIIYIHNNSNNNILPTLISA
ncbi:MAG: hypothetical protein QG673_2216 [Pseudomonadota bacterium]|nr:hypothetical protein [Pseudomonadota bacterium]